MTRHLLVAAALALLAPAALAQDAEPQDSWMVHVDGSGDALRFVPARIIVVPGGTVQLMVFGNGHGAYSLTLDGVPELSAEVDTADVGIVHVAEFAAPTSPGDYPFHDEHHPAAKGVLVVRAADAASETKPEIGVGNGYDTQFYPARLEVHAGEAFTFRNNASEIIHTMTARDGSFDADAVRAGEMRVLTAPAEPGEYEFICKYHEDSGMRGTLIVLPAREGAATAPVNNASAENAERANTPGAAIGLVLAVVALAAFASRKRE